MIKQEPLPGDPVIRHVGDTLTFNLRIEGVGEGAAWLRTNLGRAEIRRREVLAHAEKGRAILARDWHDIPLRKLGGGEWAIRLPLLQTGCFRAKVFYLEDGREKAIWPEGEDVVVKVEPAAALSGNSIYTVFPRQFGPGRELAAAEGLHRQVIRELDEEGYTVVPPSGTFRDVIGQLDFIMGEMGFRIIQLLPIHPVPTTYARMGRYGSPFAATDFFSVDPALAEFDRRTTPLEQFWELTDAVHARRGRVFIDLPANHTGWASHFQTHHPEWFCREANGEFASPGAWGVVWADLCKLDYRNRDLWREIAEVFLFWCRQGVDGFRCDAGYMVPLEVWTYVSAKVRNEFPDCIFMLEGLGGPIPVMESLLTEGNLNWAYSELFQNYTREQISNYLPGCIRTGENVGALVHFAETHDNRRLASVSPAYARMRTALCALFSQGGAFGITNGVEWFAAEKVDVHGASALNWGSGENQVDQLKRLLAILEVHPAFRMGTAIRLVQTGPGNSLALLRQPAGDTEVLLVLINLDVERESEVEWFGGEFPAPPEGGWRDLLGGGRIAAGHAHKGGHHLRLGPGAVLCLAPTDTHLGEIDLVAAASVVDREPAPEQRFGALVLQMHEAFHGFGDLADFDVPSAVQALRDKGPADYLRDLAAPTLSPPTVAWNFPRDARRCVVIAPGQILLVFADDHFLAEIREKGRVVRRAYSLPLAGRPIRHFALFAPLEAPDASRPMELAVSVFREGGTTRVAGPILVLCPGERAMVRMKIGGDRLRDPQLYALCANRLGGMAQVRAAWAELHSQYDAFLAANCHPDYPVDRQVMLRRLRGWVVHKDYSQELNGNCQVEFEVLPDGTPRWVFDVPVGQGRTIGLEAMLRMAESGNAVKVAFRRLCAGGRCHCLADELPVYLILRPDLEDRSCHDNTCAMAGAEHAFPAAVAPERKGFSFNPSGVRNLRATVSAGAFHPEPAWLYMVPQPFEQNRGLAPHTDMFSPGYFRIPLPGGTAVELTAGVGTAADKGAAPDVAADATAGRDGVDAVLERALRQFIVKRDQYRTVIAGYPWFLDWGRDTLICLRGIAAAGFHAECRDILVQFARFEKRGTLPNMIRGGDDSNRDTSDAPLWFFVACGDLIAAGGDRGILDEDCGGRTVLDALISIADNYLSGTPNGIRVDVETGLVFSPSHFTWMDTNHPAGTPREGYPVEIQALWHAALARLHAWTGEGKWEKLVKQVRKSIVRFFVRPGQSFLSDCLHAKPGQTAVAAVPDDHCRPNQLLAVTLDAVADTAIRRRIVESCECLLVPGGIRSLADRPVDFPLPVFRHGVGLNDPSAPYWGRYEGDEDTRRKPAYHNGTAWTWLFPLYPEALYQVYGDGARAAAYAILMSSVMLLDEGCLGQIPEILDGDAPHTQRGCGAQAWGVTELVRVRKLLAAG